MTSLRRSPWIWIFRVCLVAGLTAAVGLAVFRTAAELSSRQVSLVLDEPAWRLLWERQGLSPVQALKEIADAGATTLSLREETLQTFQQQGLAAVFSRDEVIAARRLDAEAFAEALSILPLDALNLQQTFAVFSRPDLARQALEQLLARGLSARLYTHPLKPGGVLAVSGRGEELSERTFSSARGGFLGGGPSPLETGTGFLKEKWDAARSAGLSVAVRIGPAPAAGPDAAGIVFGRLPDRPALVIFSGDAVLGFPGSLTMTASALVSAALPWGLVEFNEPPGQARILRVNGVLDLVVRVHSLTPAEADRTDWTRARERFVRAVSERNARALYIYPLCSVPGRLWAENLAGLKALTEDLKTAGFLPKGEPSRTRLMGYGLQALAGLGILAACFLFLGRVLPETAQNRYIPWIALTAAAAWLGTFLTSWQVTGALGLAFLACLVFPPVALITALTWWESSRGNVGRRILTAFLLACGITLCGALLVAGVGSFPETLLAVRRFMGVKAALVLPFAVWAWWLWRHDPFYNREMSRPVLVRDAVLGGIAAVAAGLVVLVLLTRSGNNPVVASGGAFEEQLRSLLENLLVARPRFKEFLIGHPLLWLALYWRTDERLARYPWAGLLLLLGALIGQVSLINTFCHFHTPLWLSLLRVVNGFWTGALAGFGLVWAVRWIVKRWVRTS